jgi:hypothetical protein
MIDTVRLKPDTTYESRQYVVSGFSSQYVVSAFRRTVPGSLQADRK